MRRKLPKMNICSYILYRPIFHFLMSLGNFTKKFILYMHYTLSIVSFSGFPTDEFSKCSTKVLIPITANAPKNWTILKIFFTLNWIIYILWHRCARTLSDDFVRRQVLLKSIPLESPHHAACFNKKLQWSFLSAPLF